MKSFFKFCKNNIVIIFTIIFATIFKISLQILTIMELMYREWVCVLAIIIIATGIIIWIYQFMLKIKKIKYYL